MTMELKFDLSTDPKKHQYVSCSIDCECVRKKFQIRVGHLRGCSLLPLLLYTMMQPRPFKYPTPVIPLPLVLLLQYGKVGYATEELKNDCSRTPSIKGRDM